MSTEKYEERICSSCSKLFQPSSRHKCCPRCRSSERWKGKEIPCDICSKPCKSGRCASCGSRMRKGREGTNWKGGECKTSRGYILQFNPGHPRNHGGNGKYVLQHILVMENKIGRYLNKGETVHHKNGIKDDNRIENLELWASNHPSGQRVEDLLEWAYALIEEYGALNIK